MNARRIHDEQIWDRPPAEDGTFELVFIPTRNIRPTAPLDDPYLFLPLPHSNHPANRSKPGTGGGIQGERSNG